MGVGKIIRNIYIAPGSRFTPNFQDEGLGLSIPRRKSIDITELCVVDGGKVILDYGLDSNRIIVQVRAVEKNISFHFVGEKALEFACGFHEIARELGLERHDFAHLIWENAPWD
ncbi:MAG: hypothetical protein ACD_56C00161G0003 [uncultured bacterium]|nr:MAG: hypothetical protein ACD_56C00161G0003 [uncultured bacterium]